MYNNHRKEVLMSSRPIIGQVEWREIDDSDLHTEIRFKSPALAHEFIRRLAAALAARKVEARQSIKDSCVAEISTRAL